MHSQIQNYVYGDWYMYCAMMGELASEVGGSVITLTTNKVPHP